MSGKKLPKLVVFDLDYTLWPFWVDTHVTPPFRRKGNTVVDHFGKKISYYPDVPEVLEKLSKMNCAIGIASRTSEIEGANQLIELFGWEKYFKFKEIYPGRKTNHFNRFKISSNIPYEEMLFFDDEHRNINDVSQLKVVCILVENGVSMKELERGLKLFSDVH